MIVKERQRRQADLMSKSVQSLDDVIADHHEEESPAGMYDGLHKDESVNTCKASAYKHYSCNCCIHIFKIFIHNKPAILLIVI